jgi:cytidylate kinase
MLSAMVHLSPPVSLGEGIGTLSPERVHRSASPCEVTATPMAHCKDADVLTLTASQGFARVVQASQPTTSTEEGAAMSIITISRGTASGGQALAERVAAKLGWPCLSNEVIVEAAKRYGVPEPELVKAFETAPTFWEKLTASRRVYLTFVQAAMCEYAEHGNLVYHGYAGHELLPGISHVLKVRLVAPLGYRIHAVMERDPRLDRKGAMRYINRVDEERTSRMRYLFDVDWRDPQQYDLVLSLNKLSLETACNLVIQAIQWPEFQPTETSRKALENLALSSRIRAALDAHPQLSPYDITVEVAEGTVTLSGSLPTDEARREVLTIAEHTTGVQRINNQLVRK